MRKSSFARLHFPHQGFIGVYSDAQIPPAAKYLFRDPEVLSGWVCILILNRRAG